MNTRKKKQLEKDRDFQISCKQIYNSCCLCTSLVEVIHHFIHKSQCAKLRYDIKNAVPLCKRCHFRVHSRNNPIDVFDMSEFMVKVWGKTWIKQIRTIASP